VAFLVIVPYVQSHCSVIVQRLPQIHHFKILIIAFLIKSDVRNPSAKPRKSTVAWQRAAAEIKKLAACASIQQSDRLRAEEFGRDVCSSLMTAQF
jgi:hypothetical protein